MLLVRYLFQFTAHEKLTEMQNESIGTELLAYQEALKTMPFGDVWDQFLSKNSLYSDLDALTSVKKYEEIVLIKRA